MTMLEYEEEICMEDDGTPDQIIETKGVPGNQNLIPLDEEWEWVCEGGIARIDSIPIVG